MDLVGLGLGRAIRTVMCMISRSKKTRFILAASAVGVLAAGSAAAMANDAALTPSRFVASHSPDDDSTSSSTATSATTATSVSTAATTATTATTASTPTSNSTETSSSTPGTPAAPVVTTVPAPSATSRAFQVGDAGTVVVDTVNDRLSLLSATPNPGWQVVKAETNGTLSVEVKFQSATTRVEFHANLMMGTVSTSVEVTSLNGATPDTSSTIDDDSTSSTLDDDDDESTSSTIDDGDDDDDDDSTSSTIDDDDDDSTDSSIDDSSGHGSDDGSSGHGSGDTDDGDHSGHGGGGDD